MGPVVWHPGGIRNDTLAPKVQVTSTSPFHVLALRCFTPIDAEKSRRHRCPLTPLLPQTFYPPVSPLVLSPTPFSLSPSLANHGYRHPSTVSVWDLVDSSDSDESDPDQEMLQATLTEMGLLHPDPIPASADHDFLLRVDYSLTPSLSSWPAIQRLLEDERLMLHAVRHRRPRDALHQLRPAGPHPVARCQRSLDAERMAGYGRGPHRHPGQRTL